MYNGMSLLINFFTVAHTFVLPKSNNFDNWPTSFNKEYQKMNQDYHYIKLPIYKTNVSLSFITQFFQLSEIVKKRMSYTIVHPFRFITSRHGLGFHIIICSQHRVIDNLSNRNFSTVSGHRHCAPFLQFCIYGDYKYI